MVNILCAIQFDLSDWFWGIVRGLNTGFDASLKSAIIVFYRG
jgi:hypothetical protein